MDKSLGTHGGLKPYIFFGVLKSYKKHIEKILKKLYEEKVNYHLD